MFSKLTTNLVVVLSLTLAHNAYAQTAGQKKAKAAEAKALEAKKAEEAKAAKAAEEAAAAKAAEEAKRAEEAKLADDKAAAEDSSGAWGYIKSKFSASYHGEYYFTRKDVNSANEDDHDIQDLKIMHNPTIIYRPIKNWKFLVTSEFKYTDAAAKGTFINRHFRSLVLLTRENILTEKEDGIKMDVGIGRRIFDRNKGAASSYGNSRINTSLSKKFGDNLSTSLFAQYLYNDPVKRKIAATTWRHSLELIPSFTFQITEKLSYFFNDDFIINTPWRDNANSFDISHEMNVGVVSYQFNDQSSAYFQFKYLHFSGAPFQAATAVDDWFEYYIGYTYSITPKVSITPEIGSKIFGAKDGRDFFANEIKYPEFAVYFDAAF